MHNFPLLFLCEKEKRQNTSDKCIKEFTKQPDMSDEKAESRKNKI